MSKNVRISTLRELECDEEGLPVQAGGYDEHTAAVRAGFSLFRVADQSARRILTNARA
ncbi:MULTISPECIES: hypothetical protein [unclassified Streptomyces]|uniref:hypothetical protein n=1 Tax=unclassified Streptomyces TaxID=2593676 RepID=UPI00131ADC62|nr:MULTISPECIES: hypothetical protein [unclassified Streptomyces]